MKGACIETVNTVVARRIENGQWQRSCHYHHGFGVGQKVGRPEPLRGFMVKAPGIGNAENRDAVFSQKSPCLVKNRLCHHDSIICKVFPDLQRKVRDKTSRSPFSQKRRKRLCKLDITASIHSRAVVYGKGTYAVAAILEPCL